jgi:hypothetical protein
MPDGQRRARIGRAELYTHGGVAYCGSMWHVTGHFQEEQLNALPAAGFTVSSTGGVVRVMRHGCAAEFRRTPEGAFEMTQPPSVMLRGQFTRLWDAGYQKFLLYPDGKKFPALAAQLSGLRQFTEELQTALGIPTYYNSALGSTCQLTTYDRVKGRPGDVPDQSVGAQPSEKH